MVVMEAQCQDESGDRDAERLFDTAGSSGSSISPVPLGGSGCDMENHMLLGAARVGGGTGSGVHTGKFGGLTGAVGTGTGASYVLGNGSDCRTGI